MIYVLQNTENKLDEAVDEAAYCLTVKLVVVGSIYTPIYIFFTRVKAF